MVNDRMKWAFIWTVAIGGMLLVLFGIQSVPAQVLTPERIQKAKVGDVLVKSGNAEVIKASATTLTSKIYSLPQWDANGKSLIAYDAATGKVTSRMRYVRFVPDAATEKLPVARETRNASIKEFWTVPNDKTEKLAWTVETDAARIIEDNGLIFLDTQGGELFRSPAPVAWDADNKPVDLKVTFDGKILTYEIVPGEYKYPVTVDPSVKVVDDTDTATGTTFGDNATYLTIRNAADAPSAANNGIIVGQRWGSPNYTVWRGHLTFPTSFLQYTAIDSAKVKLVISADNTTEEFNIHMVEGTFTGNVAVGWHNDFTGWAASGAYSVTNLITPLAAAGSVGDTLTLKLNAAGLTAINEKGNTTLTLLSNMDIAATQPSDEGHMTFEDDSAYFQVWYKISAGLTRTVPYDRQPNYLWYNGEAVPIWRP